MPARKSDAFHQKDPVLQCRGKTRRCRKCGYDFIDDRLLWDCPVCGENRRCREPAYYPWKNCRRHGPQRGPAVRTGGQSQWPIANIANKYLKAQSDGELLALRPLMNIWKQRIIQLLERVDIEDSDKRHRMLVEAWNKFKRQGIYNRLEEEEQEAFDELEDIMDGVFHDYMSWNELLGVSDHYRKLSESEVKRLKEMQQYITAEEIMDLMGQVYAAIVEEFGDQPTRIKNITTKFARIFGSGLDYSAERRSRESGGDRPSIVDSEEFLDS